MLPLMFCANLLVLIFCNFCAIGNAVPPTTTTVPPILTHIPIVMWHGMGDSCCFPFSMGAVTERLKEALPNVYVLSLQIGPSIIKDVENGYFLHPDKQIEMVCKTLAADSKLKDGYNAIGFSQGGQFLRAVAQRCPSPPMRNLISVGGQHQGVFGLPNCGSLTHASCEYMRRLLNYAAYTRYVQKELVQATYWHDPLHEEEYRNYSTFLADINNEKKINMKYVKNLGNLANFVMVRFENDTIVQPVETEWFGFYTPGQDKQIQVLAQTALYKEDRLGLRQMNRAGKLSFLTSPGNHLKFEWNWFKTNIIDQFLFSAE